MKKKKKLNSIEYFEYYYGYKRASQSEDPDEKCKDCSALFTFKGKTRCYVYEQQLIKDKIEFHPRRDYNCKFFENTDVFINLIYYYKKALAKRSDPENDPEYKNIVKEDNDYYEALDKMKRMFSNCMNNVREEWDDPHTYANCSDWESEPKNCFCCGDDECPMNQG